MCELSLDETGLESKRGAEITGLKFHEAWTKHGGDEYLEKNKNKISSQYLKNRLSTIWNF